MFHTHVQQHTHYILLCRFFFKISLVSYLYFGKLCCVFFVSAFDLTRVLWCMFLIKSCIRWWFNRDTVYMRMEKPTKKIAQFIKLFDDFRTKNKHRVMFMLTYKEYNFVFRQRSNFSSFNFSLPYLFTYNFNFIQLLRHLFIFLFTQLMCCLGNCARWS